jgi:guanosine-3',5'-bis(diphosphate) 3'-pyrophosphohydrolase
MSELVEKAKAFAIKAHEGQTRLNKDKTPLVTHLEDVVSLVRESGGSDEELAAAWLHDVVEDTQTLFTDIANNFGEKVASIVFGLTDPPGFNRLHTLERKTAQADRVRYLSDSVKRVKMADQTSNVRSVATDPPVHWDAQKCLDYVEGAKKIVLECRDVNEFLFGKFCKAYRAALRVHKK